MTRRIRRTAPVGFQSGDGRVDVGTDAAGVERLTCGNLSVVISRPDPVRVVLVPFDHDDRGTPLWRVPLPQSLADEFTQAAARGHRGPGRVLEVILKLSLQIPASKLDSRLN